MYGIGQFLNMQQTLECVVCFISPQEGEQTPRYRNNWDIKLEPARIILQYVEDVTSPTVLTQNQFSCGTVMWKMNKDSGRK